jgi:hypothetical protein
LSNPQIEQFERQIREKLPTHSSPEHAAEVVRKDVENLGLQFSGDMQANLEAACVAVKASIENVEILRRCSLTRVREDWYDGPKASDWHWPALDGYLRNTKGWGREAIASIDDTSSEVVSLLANPAGDQFRCRGLVVGYVQSGKTANMTAVIAKAVDAGYNLIVLLGGMTNKLRAQTQRRLEADIVGRHRHLWQLYTKGDDDGDFIFPANSSFTMPVEGRAQLVVMKKTTSRLNSFHRTITKTPKAILTSLKVLLIDDECDQASVNSAKDDYDITKINEAIRKIIRSLPAVSYVGYTATPFANVFINPFPHNREELDDLYPEDFITSLPLPKGYFGPREVFGTDPLDADSETESEAGRDMIRPVPEEELASLRPAKAADKDIFHPVVTPALQDALLWFIASCAIRRMRGQSSAHMTMLVHTSPNVIQHRRMADAIGTWVDAHAADLRAGSGEIFGKLSTLVAEEFERVPLQDEHARVTRSAEDILGEIGAVLDALEIAIENGESDERLDYTGDARTYIVVGGAVLARGLTLEGLSVSFFLRTAKQYDTLLQMGRWFGYRHGYEDLPRLWTTASLAAGFRALAHIEEEIREDIDVYRDRKTSPLDFAVRVRAIPGMAITSATKMKHAHRTSISFEGRHIQTIRFDHRIDDVVAENWATAARLIHDIAQCAEASREGANLLYRKIPAETIRRFLTTYELSDHHMDLKKAHLLGFFDDTRARTPEWNVGVITPKTELTSRKPLGPLGQVRLVQRSRLDVDGSFADIKALMSKQDILIDAEHRPEKLQGATWEDFKACRPPVPLLLLYAIDRNSQPRKTGGNRVELGAVDDLLGIGIVFPGEPDRSGNYYQVMIDAPTPEQLDEEEVVEELDDTETDLING